MIEAFVFGAAGLYLAEYGVLHVGQRLMARRRRAAPVPAPRITILVAARNEEANIERCLRCLLAQDYPVDCLEVIAVNDDSDDATLTIMNRIVVEHPGRLRVVTTVPEQSQARGKAGAIAQGLDNASGEIILLTDADCLPPPTWVRAVVEYMTPDVGICCGFTIVEAGDLLSSVQQLDWMHLQTLGSSALGLGFPVGVIGNNFAFRREAYDAVGGYRAVPFTVTEDFALFQAMTSKGYHAIFPCHREARMVTLPCRTLGEVLRQKQRWARGGTESTVAGYTLFIVALVMLIAFGIAPLVSLRAWGIVWLVKFACDLLLIGTTLGRLGMLRQIRWFIFFEFYFVVQLFLIPLLLMNRTVVWKGRAYR